MNSFGSIRNSENASAMSAHPPLSPSCPRRTFTSSQSPRSHHSTSGSKPSRTAAISPRFQASYPRFMISRLSCDIARPASHTRRDRSIGWRQRDDREDDLFAFILVPGDDDFPTFSIPRRGQRRSKKAFEVGVHRRVREFVPVVDEVLRFRKSWFRRTPLQSAAHGVETLLRAANACPACPIHQRSRTRVHGRRAP